MLYGHRNDVDGYAKALTYFDERLPEILEKMRDEDILMITADHGCDLVHHLRITLESIRHSFCMASRSRQERTMAHGIHLPILRQRS